MYSLEEEVKKIKESVKNLNNLPLQKINVIFDSIKNVYNLQTFDFIYNKVKYMKLDKMNKKLKKELDDINLAKSMVSNYDDTAKKKMEMNFYEYNKIKKKLDSLKIMFLLVTILIIFPILVHMRILPKLPAVLGWGICIIMIIIIGVFLLFIRDKYKPQFCTKDEDGFEQCSDVNNDTRYYENLDLLEKKSSAYTLDDLSDMSNSEKKRCEKWEGVKDEFDFDHIKCPNFLKEDTPPYTGSCLPIDPAQTPLFISSDRKLKKNIRLLGKSPSGLNIYTFEYKNKKFGKGIWQGVMSDEIPQQAVIKHKDGYDRVDYYKLDVEFKQIII